MEELQAFLDYKPGDIITLSDFQTQKDFDASTVDFLIESIRVYEDPNGSFRIYGYVVKPEIEGKEDEPPYLIAIKAVGDVFDIFVYYLDSDGPVYMNEGEDQDCEFLLLLNNEFDGFLDRLEVQVTTEKGEEFDINWDLQDETHGVVFSDGTEEGITTLADYYTEDDNGGNNYCLVDWRGDVEKGFMEVWYGRTIQPHEIEIVPTDG